MSDSNVKPEHKSATLDDLIKLKRLRDLEKDAVYFSGGEIPNEYFSSMVGESDSERENKIRNAWLRWIQAEAPSSAMTWAYLVKRKNGITDDRDFYVSDFFHQCETNEDFKNHVEEFWCPWQYYKDHFFYWFLNRYQLQYAIRVFSPRGSLQWFPVWGNAILILLIWSNLLLFPALPMIVSLLFFIVAIACGLVFAKTQDLPPLKLVHAMAPRLAGTTAIGYLFLLSLPQFISFLCRGASDTVVLAAAGTVLLLFMLILTVLQIQKRVKPSLPVSALCGRALQLMTIAMAYSSLGLFLTKDIVFVEMNNGVFRSLYPGWPQLFLVAVISLTIGVLLQLAWEEKPVTEPL